VRLYAQNREISYAAAYFEEANITKRREAALEALQDLYSTRTLSHSLEDAIRSSNALMEREMYSMKLVSVAMGYEDSLLPAEIQLLTLTREDALLSAQGMIEKARNLVFDSSYQEAKHEIYGHLTHFTEGILAELESREADIYSDLKSGIYSQRALLGFLLILEIIIFGGIIWLVIKPLQIFLACVEENTPFRFTHSYEFNRLAAEYNRVYKKNELFTAAEAMLVYKAEHDPLTNLLNRNVFDQMETLIESSPLALLLIDLDYFKAINDTHGHLVGDQILQKAASSLKDIFRAKDFVFRIGGDEFACIMMDITQDQAYIIKDKVNQLNHFLQNPEDGLPPISMSVGITFSSRGYSKALYEQADQALYHVKNHGRCGSHIYPAGCK